MEIDDKYKHILQMDIKPEAPHNIFQYLTFLISQYNYKYKDLIKAGYGKYMIKRLKGGNDK